MRPEQTPELDAEQEVELGRYWSAIVARWWLPIVGIVAGAIVGILVQVGSSQTWTATAVVYLGQPFGPGGSSPVSAAPTSLGLVSNLATSDSTIKTVAATVGLRQGQLRGHISTKPILGVTGTKVGTPAPLLDITVQGRPAKKIAAAAKALADVVIAKVSDYSRSKLQTLRDQLAYDTSQLKALGDRLDAARANEQQVLHDKAINATDKLVALANLSTVISIAVQQQNLIEQDRFTTRQQLALAENIESGRLVTPTPIVATRTSAPSKRAGAAIGAFIGLIFGLLAALLWEPVAARLRARPAG